MTHSNSSDTSGTSSDDRIDKHDLSIQFVSSIQYTEKDIAAGNKLAEVLNDPELSQSEIKDKAWEILNN